MSIPMTQPTATRSGVPLTGSPAIAVLSGRDGGAALRGDATPVGPTASTLTASTHTDSTPADDQLAVSYPVDKRAAAVRTDLFDVEGVVRFESNPFDPSDIRVTTRGIPV